MKNYLAYVGAPIERRAQSSPIACEKAIGRSGALARLLFFAVAHETRNVEVALRSAACAGAMHRAHRDGGYLSSRVTGGPELNTSRVRSGGLVLALAAALSLVGCGDSTSPGVEPEISNTTDSFEFQITDVREYSQNMLYRWENTGSVADVNQASTVTAGSITLRVYDDNDAQVYSRSLTENGSFVTGSGAAGIWTILVVFADATGTVNFRVEKRP